MRFLAFLNLFLYMLFSLHAGFESHVQVLCLEKDGHAAIETYDLSQAQHTDSHTATAASAETRLCCPDAPGECEDCKDIYLGTGHPEIVAYQNPEPFQAQGNLQSLLNLQQLQPLTASPLQTVALQPLPLPPLAAAPPQPVHLTSTVLLI